MASDRLFQMLAEAKSQPDRWARAVNAGAGAAQNILGGYIGGLQAKNEIGALKNAPQVGADERQMKFLDNFGKLSEQVGRKNAIQYMGPMAQRYGIDLAKLNPSTPATTATAMLDTSAPQIASSSMNPNIDDYDTMNAPIIRRSSDQPSFSAPSSPTAAPDYQAQLKSLVQSYQGGEIGNKEYQRSLEAIRTGSRMIPSTDPVMTGEDALKAGTVQRGTRIVNPRAVSKSIAGGSNPQQDKLENQAISRLSGIRGDTALSRIESQRDASIQAYNTIEQVKKEGRMPSQIEYYDILGQMWKARTGASPSDQAIRDLDAKTFRGDLGKAQQYFTGQPAGRTTADVLQNIQNFAASTGQQNDKLHDGYMQTHLIKPSGLDPARWQSIMATHRGMSFQEATGSQGNPNVDSGVPQGMVHIKDSQGGEHYLPQGAFGQAKQRDPGLQVMQ